MCRVDDLVGPCLESLVHASLALLLPVPVVQQGSWSYDTSVQKRGKVDL